MKSHDPDTSVVNNSLHTSDSQASVTDEQRQILSPPRIQRRWWLLLALLLMGGGIILWRMLSSPGEQSAAQAEPPGVKVKLATVETGTLEESSDLIASLQSRRSVTLQPRIQGQVSQIFVRAGDQVALGRPIMQVDAAEQQAAASGISAAAQAATAEVENARSTLRSLQAERLSNLSDVRLNQQDYQRYSSLAAQGAVSRQTQEQYNNRLQAARSSLGSINAQIQAQQAVVSQAEKALLQAQANIKEQQVQLQYYRISAPLAGTVGDIPVKVGDFVNTSTPLTTITQNRPLEVNISVPIERSPQLRLGMPVEVMNAQGQRVGTSNVFFISPNVTNDTQSVLIKSLFANSRDELRADQFARARVIWNQRPGVLIPTTAVSRLAGETFVYVAQPKGQSPQGQPQLIARQKPVKLGEIKGNNYQVIEGIQPGEKIVVSGILNLKDGAPIIPETSKESQSVP